MRPARDLGAAPVGGDDVAGDDVEDATTMVLDDVDDEVEADLARDLFHAETAGVSASPSGISSRRAAAMCVAAVVVVPQTPG